MIGPVKLNISFVHPVDGPMQLMEDDVRGWTVGSVRRLVSQNLPHIPVEVIEVRLHNGLLIDDAARNLETYQEDGQVTCKVCLRVRGG